ncbi:MAG: hypothetical protein WA798_16120, partial [Candidatus Acidiferrum sp.]
YSVDDPSVHKLLHVGLYVAGLPPSSKSFFDFQNDLIARNGRVKEPFNYEGLGESVPTLWVNI